MFVIRPDLNTTEIEKRVNDYTIFKYYTTHFKKTNTKFKSEFRKDKNPSASITEYSNRLWYKDFGDPMQVKAYDIYSFIQRKYNISFRDALIRINQDFNLNLGCNTGKVSKVKYEVIDNNEEDKEEKILSTIKVRKVKFTNTHMHFWEQYKISKWNVLKLCTKYEIFPISHFWLQNTPKINNQMYVVNNLGFDYDYDWYKGIFLRKIYLPSKQGSTFFTNCNTLITQGYKQLPPTGDLVFVTSSLKDAVILRNNDFYAVAPSNENVFIPEYIFEDLKKRFKTIVLFYDNDFTKDTNWGKLFAQKHSEKYNIPYIILPDNTEKDPSDFVKTYSNNDLISIINEKIKTVC